MTDTNKQIFRAGALDELYSMLPATHAQALIEKFASELENYLSELKNDATNVPVVESICHKLVSIAAGLGLEQLADESRLMMQAAKQVRTDAARMNAEQWLGYFAVAQKSCDELTSFLKLRR